MDLDDLYEVLNVSPDATESDIKKAYKSLVRKYFKELFILL
jgi:curved DNA-binding protein CbpA